MALLPGEILNRRYRIVSLLAEGKYGAVYRALDTENKFDVAIKEYLDADVGVQKAFRQEARQLSRLSHPQLPQLLDHFALPEVGQYLVWSYVDGVDLRNLLQQYGTMPSDLVIGWLQAVCKPLTYLHEQKRLHLNIKPANIRVTPAGDVFLVDSGLPGLGILPRSDGYGAPEQEAKQELSVATDIYSLGATLYTLLTGQEPPKALSRETGLVDLLPAREVNPNVEPYLSLVGGRAMSLRADSRYETAVSFSNALNRPVGHPPPVETTEPRRTTSTTQFGRPLQPIRPSRQRRQMERRTIFALGGILAIILLLTFLFSTINFDSDPEVTEIEATATLESAVVAALTAIAPSPSPLPVPTNPPTPTPEPIISDTGARMLYVPGGLFRMGDEDGERDERPSHIVNLSPYFIDETEVTNGQYELCVAAGVCRAPSRSNPTTHPAYYGDPAYADYPVVFVNWQQADTFCEWRDARLPTEAEWEMAAGFDPVQALILRYPWGDAFDGTKLNFCDANCPSGDRDSTWDDGHRDTAPVGSYSDGRSPIGAYDMSGNVMEWVNDWYDSRYYENTTDTNPMGPPEGDIKVFRGGSWLAGADEVHVSARGSFEPAVVQTNLGFRCAMSAP